MEPLALAGFPALALRGEPAWRDDLAYLSLTGDCGFWNRLPAPDQLEAHLAAETPLLAPCALRALNLEFVLPGSRGREIDRECERVVLDVVAREGFGLVSLANNHALAFGGAGLAHNLARLDAAGVAVVGLRERPVHLAELGGRRVAVYSVTDLLDDADPEGRVLRCTDADLSLVAEAAAGADLRVAFPHLGSRSVYPSPHELENARRLVAGGADLVVCTGSHFPKGVVEIDGRTVLFGLGNHLFTWGGGGTEPVGAHCLVGVGAAGIEQILLVPFRNAVMRGETGPLDEAGLAEFAGALADRSTADTARFFADPRVQAGLAERLKGLRPADLGKLRWRHVQLGLEALAARLRRRG